MVGTVFCHAVSNALALQHFNSRLLIHVHGARDVSLLERCLPCDRLITDDAVVLRVPLGHLQPGQKRSLMFRTVLSDADSSGFSFQVCCKYLL